MGFRPSIYRAIAAISLILTGCQNSPDPEEQKILRVAERMESSGNKRDAANVYKELLSKTDKKLPIYLKMSDSLIAAGDIKGAQTVLQEALAVDEKNQIKLRLAKCFLLEGAQDKALSLYQQIIQTDPENAQCHNGIGLVHTLNGADEPALAAYQRAITLDSSNVEYQSNCGLAYAFKGDYSKALEILKPLGTQIKATPRHRHNLAFVYALMGDESKAHALFAQDLSPEMIEKNLQTIRYIRTHPLQRGVKSGLPVIHGTKAG